MVGGLVLASTWLAHAAGAHLAYEPFHRHYFFTSYLLCFGAVASFQATLTAFEARCYQGLAGALERSETEFQNMRNLFLFAQAHISKTFQAVEPFNSPEIEQVLDAYYQDLLSENVAILVAQQRWEDINRFLQQLIGEVEELRRMAEEPESPGSPSGMSEAEAFDVLKIPQGSPWNEIKKAFRQAAKRYNIDHRQHLSEAEKEQYQEQYRLVIQAYDLLKEKYG
jgi:DnaJ-domain-containing protein 1